MSGVPERDAALERQLTALVREESAQVVAQLISLLGDFDRAEELWQETLVAAMEAWRRGGVPQRPGAWLTTAARNRALDVLR
ncbi:MAG: sigma factor, partial [Myxococcales bacterium]